MLLVGAHDGLGAMMSALDGLGALLSWRYATDRHPILRDPIGGRTHSSRAVPIGAIEKSLDDAPQSETRIDVPSTSLCV